MPAPDRNANVKCRANTHFRVEIDGTPVPLFHNLFGYRKTQARAHTHRFGRISLSKNPVPAFGRDSSAGIGDGNMHVFVLQARPYRDLAISFDGLPGIDENIQKYLVEKVGKTLHLRELPEIRFDRDPPPELGVCQLERAA